MKNMRKTIRIRIVKNAEDFIKYTSRPTSYIYIYRIYSIRIK